MQRVSKLNGDVVRHNRTIQSIDQSIDRIRQDQDRVRRNLQAVDRKGPLARTYLDRLSRQESDMARLEDQRSAAEEALANARAALEEIVRNL